MTSSKLILWTLLGFLLMDLAGCSAANRSIASRKGFNREQNMQGFYKTEAVPVGETFTGEASYYGPGFHGKKTANGETYDQDAMTCAHKTLPFGTILEVTLLSTGKSIEVRVTDRGPYKDGRILDLSVAAARQIGLIGPGVGEVRAKVLK